MIEKDNPSQNVAIKLALSMFVFIALQEYRKCVFGFQVVLFECGYWWNMLPGQRSPIFILYSLKGRPIFNSPPVLFSSALSFFFFLNLHNAFTWAIAITTLVRMSTLILGGQCRAIAHEAR